MRIHRAGESTEAVKNVFERRVFRKLQNNNSRIFVGWKLNRVGEVEVECHKTALLAVADIDQRMIGCAAKALANDSFDIEPALD